MANEGSSMLDVILERMRTENQKQVIHSFVSVSKLSPEVADKRDIGVHYEKLYKACRQHYQGDGPTGLLLIYPQHCVHLVEAPWEVVTAVISDLEDMDNQRGYLVSTHLLAFTTNVQQRLFPQWSFRVLDLPALPKGETYKSNDPIEQTVASNLELLYKLGVHFSKLAPHNLKITLDSLPEKLPHFLLEQDVLEYFVTCSDLNTPKEIRERYCTPAHTILDSELVWPIPVRLFPYD